MSEKAAMSPESSNTKRRSLNIYASNVFKESSVGMVSSVASTTSIRRKIFKVLALIVCLTGFLYQSGQFLAVAFQYPTTVDIDVLRPDTFNVPAYTFCDDNGINRRIFCDKYPDRCEEPSDELCEKYESYCGENKSLVPKKEYFSYHEYIDGQEVIELNVKVDEFATYMKSRIDDNITGPYFRRKDLDQERAYLCYTLNDRANNSLYPASFTQQKLMRTAVDILLFKVRAEEVFLPGARPGILFALHSPFAAVNPFESGIFLKPGRTYMVFISMEEEILQKRPYDTDCVNYTEIWEKNGRSGPRMQEMCYHDCWSDISVLCFNCVVPFFYFPRKEKYCTGADMQNRKDSCENGAQLAEECFKNCRDDCRTTKYHYTVQERFGSHYDDEGNLKKDIDNTIKVEIYIEEDEIIVYKHSPKYMIVEVFSSIGGFVGCWLGISLLDITDIAEGFVRIFRYSFKRR